MQAIKQLIIVFSVFMFTACDLTFEQRFENLKQGLSRADVIQILGEPELIRNDTLPDSPFWGPQEILTSILQAGSEYEEWQYQHDGHEYYVWFASPEGKAKEAWQLLIKSKYPQGAVYEAEY